MANVVSKWERLIAVGCSHGHLGNKSVQDEVLSLCERWKPKHRIHLGDFLDLAAFRSGARGTNDEAANVAFDLKDGFQFLTDLRPTLVFMGNHEDRLFSFQQSPNALKAHVAGAVLKDLDDLRKKVGFRLVEKYGVRENEAWVDIGNARFLHGYMYSENATRDHAEAFAPVGGSIVHAHTHRPDVSRGRRYDSPTGYCVGTLSDIPAMGYAKTRRATLAWGHAAIIGETNHKETRLWLINGNQGPLRFPV